MDWVYQLVVDDGCLAARAVDDAGNHSLLTTESLATRGLPVGSSKRRRVYEVNLATASVVSAERYRAVVYPHAPPGLPDDHQVFEFTTARQRYVIPALALLRGLFQPAKHFMPEIFRPHIVQRVCVPGRNPEDCAQLTAPWCRSAHRGANPSALLTWLCTDNDASHMAHSVHDLAMQGVLGIRLAPRTVNFTVEGREHGGTFYVTRCAFTKIHDVALPAEDSLDACVQPDAVESTRLRGAVSPELYVLTHRDGSAELSEREWKVAYAILEPQIRKGSAKVDHRQVINGLFLKLRGDVRTWRQLSAPGISHALYLYHYRRWSFNRTLHTIVHSVNEMRRHEPSRASGDDSPVHPVSGSQTDRTSILRA